MVEKIEKNSEVNDLKKKCFIITPVGPDNSVIRRAAEGVIKSGIIPILDELGYEPKIPHWLVGSGSITKQVINLIVDSELCIVNLTGLNPNVMYELGIRHSARKPVVHICEAGTELPFDIKPERTIFYVNDMLGIESFRENLRNMIEAVMSEDAPSNPVYDAIQVASIMKKLEVESGDAMRYVFKRLDGIEESIRLVGKSNSINPVPIIKILERPTIKSQ